MSKLLVGIDMGTTALKIAAFDTTAQQLPSAEGETSSDADAGEGALLLERLTREIQREYGNGTYPDWYGGGYLDSAGDVVVLLVQGLSLIHIYGPMARRPF